MKEWKRAKKELGFIYLFFWMLTFIRRNLDSTNGYAKKQATRETKQEPQG